MGAQHTPGPWAYWQNDDDKREAPNDDRGITEAPFGICVAGSGVSVADLWMGTDCGQHISRDEAFANGRLIAAAPEMLNALKAAQVVLLCADDEKVPRLKERIALVEAAIAKATEA